MDLKTKKHLTWLKILKSKSLFRQSFTFNVSSFSQPQSVSSQHSNESCTVEWSFGITFSQCVSKPLLFRPPGTLVPGGLMFYCRCFFPFFYSPGYLRTPSADRRETLPHDRNDVFLIMQVQKFGEASPQRNWGPKTCKIQRDFRQLQTSIANISGMGQDIQNWKAMWWSAIPPAFHRKSPVNFGPLTTEN